MILTSAAKTEALIEAGVAPPRFPEVRIPHSLDGPLDGAPLSTEDVINDYALQARIDAWAANIDALYADMIARRLRGESDKLGADSPAPAQHP